MPITVQSNNIATATHRRLHSANEGLNTSMAKLSSGSKVNSARDDAAGLQISNRLNAQSRGIEVAMRNASDATSVLQVTEGALNEYTENILRIRDLTLQALNDSNGPHERKAIQEEITNLGDELSRIAQTTRFAGRQLLLNGNENDLRFQIGSDAGQVIQLNLPDVETLKNSSLIRSTTSEELGDPVPSGWKTSKGDSITLNVSKNGEDQQIHIEFSEGEPVEGVINILNSKLSEKARFFLISNRTDSGEKISRVAYSISQGSEYSGIDSVSISGSKFTHYPKKDGGNGELIKTFQTSDSGRPRSLEKLIAEAEFGSEAEQHIGRQSMIQMCDIITKNIDSYRAGIGANQNRLEKAINNLSNQNVHINSSNSRIKDTDFAKETARMTSKQILSNATTSILAQANNLPKSVSGLLS